jgi:large subunit ribosomal protein L35
MPKAIARSKTKKAVAKRFKITATGKILTSRAGRRHLASSKNRKRMRSLVDEPALQQPEVVAASGPWSFDRAGVFDRFKSQGKSGRTSLGFLCWAGCGQPFGAGYNRYASLYRWRPDARLNERRGLRPLRALSPDPASQFPLLRYCAIAQAVPLREAVDRARPSGHSSPSVE